MITRKLICLGTFCALTACGGSDSVAIAKRHVTGNIHYVILTGKVESTTVSALTVNRGNCAVNGFQKQAIKFGQTLGVTALCNPLEVEAVTSGGTVSATWSE